MSREDALRKLKSISENVKKEIPLAKFRRRKIIQEEIVEAYKCPTPSSVTKNGKNRQVEKDNWVVIHSDGGEDVYTEGEFKGIFEKIPLGESFKKEEVKENETSANE